MEAAFLLMVAASAAVGLVARGVVSRPLGRACLALGLVSFFLGLGVLGLTALGHGPFTFWPGSLVSVVLLGVAGLVLPFALVVRWGRF